MASIGEEAENYVPATTKNIADLEAVSVKQEMFTRVKKEGTPEEFSYDCIVINDEDYRVPKSVLKQLKVFQEEKPKMTTFKVKKEGTTVNDTTYTVIPLD